MKLSYKSIFKNAWDLTIKNKILWVFGFFASFISLEAVYEIILTQLNQAKQIENLHLQIINLYQSQINFVLENTILLSQLPANWGGYFLFVLLIVAVALFIWLIFISQIFIIKAIASLYKNKKLDTKKDLAHSFDKFWPVLVINIIAKLILYAAYIALSLPLLYALLAQSQIGISAGNLIFLILYTIFAVIVSFLTAYATNFVILHELNILQAFKNAWQLFSQNILLSFEIATILFFAKLISIIIIFSVTFLFAFPLVLLFILTVVSYNVIGMIMTITLVLVFFTLMSVFVNSLFTSFYLSSWTITFIELTDKSPIGKMLKLAKTVPALLKKASKKYELEIDKQELKSQSKKILKKIEKKYNKYEPIAKRKTQKAAKKLKKTYKKLEPQIEEEIKKIIDKNKRKKTSKSTSKAKKSSPKKTKK